jgi:hypothetical protein
MLSGGDRDHGPFDPGGSTFVADLLEQPFGGLHHLHRRPEIVGEEALERQVPDRVCLGRDVPELTCDLQLLAVVTE